MKKLILRSIGASLFIGLGVYILLTLNNPLGVILFSFGLLGICVLKLNLFIFSTKLLGVFCYSLSLTENKHNH